MAGELEAEGIPRKRQKLFSATMTSEHEHSGLLETNVASSDSANLTSLTNPEIEDDESREVMAGITHYIRPDLPGFSGNLKQRYADFMVNEVLPSGEVLHLKSLEFPVRDPKSLETDRNGNSESRPNSNLEQGDSARKYVHDQDGPDEKAPAEDHAGGSIPEPSEADVIALKKVFGESKIELILKLYKTVVRHPHRKPRDFDPVICDPIPDKAARTEAHRIIRNIFRSKLDSNTDEQSQQIRIQAMPRSNPRSRKAPADAAPGMKGRLAWDHLGGEYLHFTMYKENRDTVEMINFIASNLKVKPKAFQFAGTKDRRAVSVQRVCAYRFTAERLAAVNKTLRAARVGDFEYRNDPIELGQLKGNHFCIVIRDCHFQKEEGLDDQGRFSLANEVVKRSLESIKEDGYINYYGLQRFGTVGSRTTDTIGLKILQGNMEGAVADILFVDPDVITKAKDFISNGQENQSNQQQRPAQDPTSTAAPKYSGADLQRALALEAFANDPSCVAKALQQLPRRFTAERALITHLGWRDKRSGTQPRMRDFKGALAMIPRALRLMYIHAYQSKVWNTMAGRRWVLWGAEVVEGDLVLQNPNGKASNGDVEGQAEVDDVGEAIVRPAPREGGDFVRARPLSAEEAKSGQWSVHDIVLPLPGFDVEYPKNEVGDFYKDWMGSDEGGRLDPHDMRRTWREISLSGSYRKLMERPGGEIGFEVKLYQGQDEKLVDTELERLEKSMDGSKQRGDREGKEEILQSTAHIGDADKGTPKKIAVILQFQLGTSQYATVALREMSKGGVRSFKPLYSAKR